MEDATAEELREMAHWIGRAELPCTADILGMRKRLMDWAMELRYGPSESPHPTPEKP